MKKIIKILAIILMVGNVGQMRGEFVKPVFNGVAWTVGVIEGVSAVIFAIGLYLKSPIMNHDAHNDSCLAHVCWFSGSVFGALGAYLWKDREGATNVERGIRQGVCGTCALCSVLTSYNVVQSGKKLLE